MIEHPLPDVAHFQVLPALHRLAGLVCSGYWSVAGRTERRDWSSGSEYGVLYIHAGSGWVETTATVGRLAVETGALVWLFPGVSYTFIPGPAGWSEQWAAFAGPMARSFELLGLLAREHPVRRPPDPAPVAALFTQLRADSAAPKPLAGLLGGSLIHRLVVATQGAGVAAAPARTQGVQRAVALIDAWALQPLDLRAVAAECGVGYSTLRRRFKQAMGQSITDYVLRRRLGKARELLATTSMSVAEVAHAVGFADPYYFSRQFHRKEGQTPTAFRVRHRQAMPDAATYR